eukprot:Colp12_sorted_trinity150504_noHs@23667
MAKFLFVLAVLAVFSSTLAFKSEHDLDLHSELSMLNQFLAEDFSVNSATIDAPAAPTNLPVIPPTGPQQNVDANQANSSGSGLSNGAIIGISVGAVACVGIAGFTTFLAYQTMAKKALLPK